MASSVSHQLSIVIGAALGSSFNSAVSGSTSKIGQIGAAIKDMEKQSVLSVNSINKLKTRYNSFLASMNQQQKIVQKRAFYRSQIMDMVALGAALVAPINAAREFNTHLSKLNRIYNFADPEEPKKFGDLLTKMSLRMPVTANDLGKLAVMGGRFGVAIEELPEYIENVAKASKVWGMESEETGEKIGNLMKIFSIKPSEITKNFDLITRLGRDTGKTGDQVLNALITAGSGLSILKLPIDQVTAMTATMMSFGDSSEQAGSSINKMFLKLANAPKASKDVQQTLFKIGLSAKTISHMAINNPQKVLDKLFSGLSKLSGMERSMALTSIFGRKDAMSVGKLINNLDIYRENLKKAQNSGGSFEKDWSGIVKGTTSSITLLTNTISVFGREIGMSLLPTVKSLCSALSEILKPVMTFMNGNKELTSIITNTVAGFISFRIATFALGYASTFLFGGLNKLLIVFKGLRLGLALAATACRSFFKAGPLALIGAALLIVENWETVKTFFLKIWEVVEPYWLKFKAIIDEYGVTDKIVAAWNVVADFFGNIWETAQTHWLKFKAILDKYGVIDKVVSAWTTVKRFFSSIWDGASSHWDNFIAKIESLNIADKIMAAWTKLRDFFKGLWNDISPTFDKCMAPLSKLFGSAKSSVSPIGSLFSSSKSSDFSSKLPSLKSANSNPVNKNQTNNFNINVNAQNARDPEEVAKRVAEKMKNYSSAFLFDPIGAIP